MLARANGRASALGLYARHALVIVVVLLIAACSGGGCSSGCAGCGMTSLTRPIAATNVIQNAGALRVTRSGLDFLSASAPTLAGKFLKSGTSGVFQYPFNATTTSVSVPVIGNQTVNICPNGPNTTSSPEQCTVDVELGMANLHIDAVTPDSIVVSGTIPVRLQDLPVSVPTFVGNLNADINLGTNSSCNPSTANYQAFPLTITLPLVADTIAPRVGYTKIDSANIGINVNVSSGSLNICACGSVFGGICDTVLNAVKNLAFSTLSGTIQTQLKSAIQAQLCTTPDATGACPAGSTKNGANCDYATMAGTCLPIELGVDGLLNLGNLLGSISYGTTSKVDVALAAGGAMIPANAPTSLTGSPADNTGYTGHTPNGLTLGLLGALVPDPISNCVPQAANPVPTGIPIPVELEQNTITPWATATPPAPAIGLALAGRYLNYALGSVYNSGTLCLGVTTESFAQLNSGLLTLLAPSIKDLTFEGQAAAAAVTTRPQTPPTIKIGTGSDPNTDPLLMVSLNQFALDFYIWSDDRFVRAFTFTSDLTIPVNLSTAISATNPTGEIVPSLGTVTAANGVVTNSELLTDDPAKVATGLTGLVGSIVGQVAGSLKPISLASLTSSLGVNLTIPADGIRKLTSGTDDFIALFGDLAIAPAGAIKVLPQASLVGKTVHPEAMALRTYDAAKQPVLHVGLTTASATGAPVEHSYWLDQGTRSGWTTATALDIQNQALFLQGKHTLYVSAREVGAPMSESLEPVAIPFAIDVVAPTMTLTTSGTTASLTAWDFVSDQAHLEARTRVTDAAGNDGAWSAWAPLTSLASFDVPVTSAGVSSVAAEVRDEEGNVASSEVALIRGQSDATAAAGACGCSTPGTNTRLGGTASLLLAASALGLLVALRRGRRASGTGAPQATTARLDQRRRPVRAGSASARGRGVTTAGVALAVGVLTGAMSQGCSCGGNSSTALDAGLPPVDGSRPTGDGGPDTSVAETGTTGCGSDCNQPCQAALTQGIIGSYTSLAKASDGTIWVAGYNEKAPTATQITYYGDLVVGKYDTTKTLVQWASVDGIPALPAGTCPTFDPTGWRKGIDTPGNDVGLWTSIQLDANDHPIVSYYDATNAALKFASSPDGVTWTSHTVMSAANSDIGRYSKLLVVNGVPVVAFLIMEPGDGGRLRSRVELATGKTATPASATDWTFEDAAVDNTGPCRPAFCASPAVCVKETSECAPPSTACGGGGDAGAACGSTQSCVGGFDGGAAYCGTPLASPYIDIYPNAFGDYVTMAPTTTAANGVGLIVYDRIHGALIQLIKLSSGWQEVVLDSETGPRVPNPGPDGGIRPAQSGDVGVGASLFITSTGDWHVSYVNGTTEALQYLFIPGGTGQPTAPEVVDNGFTLAGAPYPDGQHIVGDDSFIEVDASGIVTISYQDASAGTLHVATGMPEATGGHTWAVLAASQPNKFAGFFSRAVYGTTSSFANFWRSSDTTTGDETGDVSFAAP